MNGWTKLDLRQRETAPQQGALVSLYLVPTTVRSQFYRSQHYEIGRFKAMDGGRKVWWQNYRTTEDPIRMKKRYEIWWRYVPEFEERSFHGKK